MSEVESGSTEPTELESNQTVDDQAEPIKEQQQTQSMIRKLKLKVDGQEFEEDYDLSNEEQLAKDLQLARAAKKRMFEAQEAKRKAFDIAQQFEQNPGSILERLGDKGYEIAEQLMLKKIQNEMMTPEQRELMELKSRLEKYEAQEKAAKEQAEKERQSQIEAKYAEQYQATIIGALEKSGLPRTPDNVKRMAYLLQKNLDLGLDLDATDLADELKRESLELIGSLTKDATAEQLMNLIGKENYKKLNKHQMEELRKRQMGGTKPIYQGQARPVQTKKRSYMSQDEWRESIASRLKDSAE